MLIYFTTSILSAALTAIPQTTRPFTSKCVPWWKWDCTRALNIKCATWCSFRCKRNTPGYIPALLSVKKASAVFKRLVWKSQTQSWRSYISSITLSIPVLAVWKRIHKISGKHPPFTAPVLKIDNNYIADSLQIANKMGQYFSQVSSGSHLPSQFTNIKTSAESNPITFTLCSAKSYNAPFSANELISALKSSHNTCEGPDNIHYQMLHHLPSTSMTFFLALLNRIWTTGEFCPSFLKPNKSGNLPQDYWPIALTNSLFKLLERMINSRLMWYLESKDHLSSSQFGYRRAKSTADRLAYIENYILTAFASMVCSSSFLWFGKSIWHYLEKSYFTPTILPRYPW